MVRKAYGTRVMLCAGFLTPAAHESYYVLKPSFPDTASLRGTVSPRWKRRLTRFRESIPASPWWNPSWKRCCG